MENAKKTTRVRQRPGGETRGSVEDAPGDDDVVVDAHVAGHTQHSVPKTSEQRGNPT